MNERPTPDLVNLMEWNRFAEENKTILEALTILNNLHPEAVSSIERERDQAFAKLSKVYRWIEKNSGDGFIDSQTHVQNLQRISDYWHDRLEGMREAIKEAHEALMLAPYRDYQTIAKLQPFLA